MPANYNYIAPIYDLLSRIIFGSQIEAAQVCLLPHIPAGSRVLIVGGGTGWILECIAVRHLSGIHIDYVEASEKMIALSRQRSCGTNTVNFINQAIENYTNCLTYDVILTPFILDNFRAEKMPVVFNKLDALLRDGGLWLYADFVIDERKSSLWVKLLLKIMYLFFRLTTGIETQELVAMDAYFAVHYISQHEEYHYARFIRSVAYLKLD